MKSSHLLRTHRNNPLVSEREEQQIKTFHGLFTIRIYCRIQPPTRGRKLALRTQLLGPLPVNTPVFNKCTRNPATLRTLSLTFATIQAVLCILRQNRTSRRSGKRFAKKQIPFSKERVQSRILGSLHGNQRLSRSAKEG